MTEEIKGEKKELDYYLVTGFTPGGPTAGLWFVERGKIEHMFMNLLMNKLIPVMVHQLTKEQHDWMAEEMQKAQSRIIASAPPGLAGKLLKQ